MTEDKIDAALFRARMPAIAMLRTPRPTDSGTPGCWFGGEPTLPVDYDWPIFVFPHAPYQGFTVPMHFLAQINLQHLPRVVGLPELPPTGTLFVFYDPIAAPLPFGPTQPLHTGEGVRVIYHPGDVSDAPARTPPRLPDLTPIAETMIYEGDGTLPRWPYDVVVVDTYDQSFEECFANAVELAERQSVALNACQGWTRYDKIRFPQPAELRVHTIFGASSDSPGPTMAKHLKSLGMDYPFPETDGKTLLFRFQSAQIAWGDETSAFWIDPDDLARADFSTISLVLEAS